MPPYRPKPLTEDELRRRMGDPRCIEYYLVRWVPLTEDQL